ncbi:MAG: hypothetical protein ACIAXF_06175 [Phycisphaerales bacterium JB063]
MLRPANDNLPAPTPRQLELTAPESLVTLTDPDQSVIASDGSSTAGANSGGSPTFSMVAYTGDAMRVVGWRHPVVVDLKGLQIPSQRRPIRFAHSAFQGIGHTERISVTSQGQHQQLVAEGVISRDTPAAREVVASGKKGFPWQASIGASVDQTELIPPGGRATVNGRTFEGPVYIAQRSTLGEISFVDLGADQQTSAQIAANAITEDSTMNNTNTDPNNDTQQIAASSKDTPTPQPTSQADPAHADISAMRKEVADELRRQSRIREVCGDRFPSIAAQAIEEGWTPDKTELETLRAGRPTVGSAPNIMAPDRSVTTEVLEAACVLSAGLTEAEKNYDEQALDTASRRFRGGIGLQELLLEAAWANGYTGQNFRNSREVLRYAFSNSVEASFSTIDIGGILSNVGNKFLLEGFYSVERTWRNITATRNVSDFKTVTSYRLVGKDQYEQVAPGGELKHGTLGNEQYANKADTYGLTLSIDRRDIINDDLGAITTVPRKLGRGSGLKINDVFWSTFLGNSDFFKADNNNYLTGASTALSIDGLTAGETAFMDQVDSDGKPIGIMPAILLVPTALSAVGTTLWKSLEIRDTSSNTKYPVANPHQGKFRVETSRYLANSQYTGNSAKAWYLLADATDLPVIETAFLNGQESPTIETAEADFNVLGIQMRGYHDFGVALQDPRGGIKAKGEA